MNDSKSIRAKRVFSAGLLSLFLISSVLSFAACGKKADGENAAESSDNASSENIPITYVINPLTGEKTLNSGALDKRPVAIVVENSPAARPQWGFCTPDIVIEGLVEGGISRMLWLYSDVDAIPDQVGPIRSARVDYVEMAAGFNAFYIHWGGASDPGISAYDRINALGVNNIDGIAFENKYFGRDYSSKSGEHTGYTKSEWVKAALKEKGYKTENTPSYKNLYKFSWEKQTLSGGVCSSVTTGFSKDYMHTFNYNEQDGLYYNHMFSTPMKDSDGKQMAVSNVIILFASHKIFDEAGHINYDLSSGKGYYIANGSYVKINWKKGSAGTEPLKLYNADGSELSLNTGKSWIGLVPLNMQGSTKIS